MILRSKFLWFAVIAMGFVLLLIVTLTVMFWQPLAPEDKAFLIRLAKENFGYIFIVGFFLFAILGLTMDWFFRFYVIPIGRLTDEAALMGTVNPSHRVKVDGGPSVVRLCSIINRNAENYEQLKDSIRGRIHLATAELESEKAILASLLAELPEGVIICNARGRILLYNKQARFYFTDSADTDKPPEDNPQRYIGLGRSIQDIIDPHLIDHAITEMQSHLGIEAERTAAYFVVLSRQSQLLKVEAVPVVDHEREFTGFILILRDISRRIAEQRQVRERIEILFKSVRASVSGIRSAVELIQEFPDMASDQHRKFLDIIHDESVNLSRLFQKEWAEIAAPHRSHWPLIPFPAADLMETVRRKSEHFFGVTMHLGDCTLKRRINVDRYSWTFALTFVAGRIAEEEGLSDLYLAMSRKEDLVTIEMSWKGRPVSLDRLREWEALTLTLQDERLPLTLGEVLRHHNAEIFSYSGKTTPGRACMGIVLPVHDAGAGDRPRSLTILPDSRPEFYDFDLFSKAVQRPEWDDRPLTSLSYTVFDTETTGLDPGGGDEIISIGAVRIVNGRLLQEDIFDQLVDPRRHLSEESIRIHRIQPESLRGKPTIDRVLPAFHRFCENTVMVAHNAAFDMRMLQVKEASSGVVFTQPVLDTLLLSAVAHPVHENHSLDVIAHRLGVSVVGRHTALGDAFTTGQVFLKLIKILEGKNIITLKQAREASLKTYYARLRY